MPDFGREVLQFTGSGAATVAALGDPVEAPFNAEIADVVVTAGTAPTGADLVVDVLVNGTSAFAAALGTVSNISTAQAAGAGWNATDVNLPFTPVQDDVIQAGQVILVGTEKILVGSVTGSSQVEQNVGVLMLTGCTRGYDGTAAATHAAGTNVLPAKPFIPAGASQSRSVDVPLDKLGAPSINKGDTITAQITQIGSTVAGANVQVEVALNER